MHALVFVNDYIAYSISQKCCFNLYAWELIKRNPDKASYETSRKHFILSYWKAKVVSIKYARCLGKVDSTLKKDECSYGHACKFQFGLYHSVRNFCT